MFIPDTPVSALKEDRLGRANFAKKLAHVLYEWEREESIVVGMYGAWGSGKTSLVNMIIECIKSRPLKDHQSPVIIYFNPWYFSNTDELLWSFFTQLFTEVGKKSQKIKDWWNKRLKNYAKAFSHAEKIPVPIVGNVIGAFGGVLDLAIQKESLSEYKEKLNEAFKELERKVIIVIDDLDRLRPTEIQQILQVVKLNANFPNTIYLLAAAREVIEKSLDTEHGVSGHNYLEKIVQVGFDIPPIDPSYISTLLLEEINRALSGYEDLFDNHRWTDIYQSGFRYFFTNLRDVKRFINGFSFNFLLVSSEVNVGDFMAIEALRVFAPNVYQGIAQNKRLFTSFWNPAQKEELRPRFDEIFAQESSYAETCKNLAIELFPQLNSIYNNFSYMSGYDATWRKARRVCVPDYFDVYFLLGVPVSEISQQELTQLKVSAQNYIQLKANFRSLVESGRYRRLLERLDEILDELEPIPSRNLCGVLLELGDELPDESKGFFDFGSDLLVGRLIYRLLWKLEELERCEWLKAQIDSNASLYTVLQEISHADSELKKRESEEVLFSEKCLHKLKQATVARITKEANNTHLKATKKLNHILLKWREWATNSDDLENYVHYMTQTPDRALAFLTGFLGRIDRYIGKHHSVSWRIYMKELEQFIEPSQLAVTLSLPLDGARLQRLSERERLAISAFTEALQSSSEEE